MIWAIIVCSVLVVAAIIVASILHAKRKRMDREIDNLLDDGTILAFDPYNELNGYHVGEGEHFNLK